MAEAKDGAGDRHRERAFAECARFIRPSSPFAVANRVGMLAFPAAASFLQFCYVTLTSLCESVWGQRRAWTRALAKQYVMRTEACGSSSSMPSRMIG